MTLEDLCIKNIDNGLRAIRLGVAPKDTLAPHSLNALKKLNPGLHADYMKKYVAAVKDYNTKTPKDETKPTKDD